MKIIIDTNILIANIGAIDYLLAATTLVLEGELATLNPKHFKIFKELPLFDLTRV